MFGFLKDKLKKAIGAFSTTAKEDVKEEVIEAPVKKAAPKKEVAKPKVVEKKQPEAKPVAKKETPAIKKAEPKVAVPPKVQEIKKIVEKPVERKPEPKVVEKEIAKPEPAKPVAQPKAPTPFPVVKKPEPKKAEPVAKPATKKEEPKVEEKKAGFFGRLFGKKEEAVVAASEAVAPHVPDAEDILEAEPEEQTIEALESVVDTYAHEEETEEEEEETADEEEAVEEVEEEVEQEETEEETEEETPEEEETEEKSGFFGKLRDAVTKRTLSTEKFDEIFWELELAMLENNVAVEVIEKIKNDLREELTTGKVSRLDLEGQVTTRLKQSIEELFDVPTFDMIDRIKKAPKPFKLCIIGVNGAGKTTTLAKIVKKLQDNDLSVVVAAADTFRAAAIQQLQEHCERLDVKMISQGYGADPAAVAFDAIKHAESKNIDVVLIDTAGRLHSNTNLMAELEKVVRVSKPDMKLFVGEATTGNDCVEQAKTFDELVGIDAIVLSKADVDEKGGAAISVSYVTGKPILYLGTGQNYEDLEEFDKEKVVGALGL